MKVGYKVSGYGWGYFGRDSYEDKVCVAVGFYDGKNYAVFYDGESFYTLAGETLEQLEEDLKNEGFREDDF